MAKAEFMETDTGGGEVTLTLSLEEALTMQDVLACVTGCPDNSARGFLKNVYYELYCQNIRYDSGSLRNDRSVYFVDGSDATVRQRARNFRK